MSFAHRKTPPTLLIVAEKKSYNFSMLEELIHGISTAAKLPTVLITSFKLPPSFVHKYPLLATETCITPDVLRKADIGLMLDGNTSKRLLSIFSEAKVVPILPRTLETHLYQNYDAVREIGNCFIYDDIHNPWSIFASIIRAVETYQFPYDWDNVVKALKSSIRD